MLVIFSAQEDCFDMLKKLSEVQRFSTAIMFFSPKDKEGSTVTLSVVWYTQSLSHIYKILFYSVVCQWYTQCVLYTLPVCFMTQCL